MRRLPEIERKTKIVAHESQTQRAGPALSVCRAGGLAHGEGRAAAARVPHRVPGVNSHPETVRREERVTRSLQEEFAGRDRAGTLGSP